LRRGKRIDDDELAGVEIEPPAHGGIELGLFILQGGELTVDISRLKAIDTRFFGFLLMVRKLTLERGGRLQFSGASARIRRAFRLHRFGFLLDSDNSSPATDWSHPELLEVGARSVSSSGKS